MKASLASEITELHFKRLAGERVYERGCKYFREGAVARLICKDDSVSARVRGTEDYRVKLWIEENALQFDCDCPMGRDGAFCKHCVATGLAWRDRMESGDGDAENLEGGADISAYLMAQNKKKLVGLLLERAEEDELFEQRLQMLAAANGSSALAVASFRKTIDAAIKRRRFVEYNEMRSYARGIEAVADSMEVLLQDGHGNEVGELSEHALKAMEKAMNNVDDSDGYMREVADRFEQLHYSACKMAKPDPKALAKFLFEWEVGGDWEMFHDAAQTYADVLGEDGLEAYRSLVEAEWKQVRPLSVREEDPERFGRRSRVGHIMERFARASGDLEALVAVKKKDLSGPFSFLGIANIYREAGKIAEAVAWAEQGAQAFPGNAGALNDFLIAEYHAAGRHAEAMALVWARFTAQPRLDTYQRLKESADTLAQWSDVREKALALLRELIAAGPPAKPSRYYWPYRLDHSLLVEIYLWEQKIDEAWNEATLGGCSEKLWLELAEKRSKGHPAEAVEVYLRYIEPTIQLTGPGYDKAVQLLRKVKQLKVQLGHPEEFVALVETIRVQHKAKRNLMKLFQAEGW